MSAHTAPQVGGEDVLGCDEQLLAEVSRLRRAVGQQLQHSLYHLLRVLPHQVLIFTHTHEEKHNSLFRLVDTEAIYTQRNNNNNQNRVKLG